MEDDIKALAGTALGWFAESPEIGWVKRDGYPEWVGELVQSAHDECMPDGFRYRIIVESLELLSDDDPHPPSEDLYTAELTAWLSHSPGNRVGYMDQAVEAYGHFDSSFQLLQAAQMEEIRETYELVLAFLESMVIEGTDPENYKERM